MLLLEAPPSWAPRCKSAFFVCCDTTTMTATQIDAGQLIVTIGVAPLHPSEFVVIQIALLANPP